jgi:glycosyltransferase involved in cell wall biosynthesis
MKPKVSSEQGLRPDNKISVCLITKNEEANIENCLKSVKDIAYEIIVVDTGSTDKTKKIASKYAKVYDFKWQDDYSKARNESIKHATGDWILVIDADEELSEKSRGYIFPFLDTQPYKKDEPVAFSLKILEPNNIIFKTVLFRAGCGIHFVKPLHEHLYRENDSLIIAKAEYITILHTVFKNSTKEDVINKNKKYIFKLLKIIKENPNVSDKSYFSYHLGNAYLTNEQFNSAMKAYQDSHTFYTQSRRPKKTQLYGNIILSQIRIMVFNKRRYKEALPLIEELLSISPNFPDALFYMAYCHEYMGDYAKAIEIYESIIKLLSQYNPDKLDPLGINSLQNFLYLMVMTELGRCFIVTGEKRKALFCLNKAFSQKSDIPEVLTILTLFYFLENDLSKIIHFYLHNNIEISEEEQEYLFKVSNLPSDDIRYKNTLVTFLQMLESSKTDWLKDELKLIRNKLSELNTVKVSVWIITKNQEEYIENCIESILPVADAITIIDTGSTDNTREIADKYGQVMEIKSANETDLKIRNYILENSGGEWILMLNGNEQLDRETTKNLLRFLSVQPHQKKAVAFFMACVNPETGEGYMKANLIRNGFKIMFADNEQLFSPEHKLLLVRSAFRVLQRENIK